MTDKEHPGRWPVNYFRAERTGTVVDCGYMLGESQIRDAADYIRELEAERHKWKERCENHEQGIRCREDFEKGYKKGFSHKVTSEDMLVEYNRGYSDGTEDALEEGAKLRLDPEDPVVKELLQLPVLVGQLSKLIDSK